MLTNNDIDLFLKVRKELDKLCETYANKHLACWQHYTGWNCYSNYIVIKQILVLVQKLLRGVCSTIIAQCRPKPFIL
jgi:hypothetical protein